MRLIVVMFLLGFESCLMVKSSEESTLLKEIVNQYSVPLAISFLHDRIQANRKTIDLIKTKLTTNLNQVKRDSFDLAEQSLIILDQQLTAMGKADYFDYNGTEKIKNFIELFTMSIEMFPIQLDFSSSLEMDSTVDQLINNLARESKSFLISQTKEMIKEYMDDMAEKETSKDSNRIQKLSASLAKAKLQQLADYNYSEKLERDPNCDNYYYRQSHYCEPTEVEKVLRQVKSIVDLFYAKFNYLGDPDRRAKMI